MVGRLEAVGAKIDQKVQKAPKLYVLEPNLATSGFVCDLDLFDTGQRDV